MSLSHGQLAREVHSGANGKQPQVCKVPGKDRNISNHRMNHQNKYLVVLHTEIILKHTDYCDSFAMINCDQYSITYTEYCL